MENHSVIDFNNVSISMDETHHIYENLPLYNSRFQYVMSYHDPGVAAVQNKDGAFHINLEGNSIYEKKFQKAFGFYEGYAAVSDNSGWYHINVDGESIYKTRYEWIGNFQEERSPVMDKLGSYFHINFDGKTVYKEKYRYVGDYKYGIAVVYLKNGFARHIDLNGNYVHDNIFEELGVFHKGFAIAKDDTGYFHINKKGYQLYKERFKWIEPFYNENSFACTFEGQRVVIDKSGTIIHRIL